MTGKCQLCGAAGAPLAESYKGRALGSALCTCCQVKVFNLMEKRGFRDADPVIAFRIERMAEVSRERRETAAKRRETRPLFQSWAAHALPSEQ